MSLQGMKEQVAVTSRHYFIASVHVFLYTTFALFFRYRFSFRAGKKEHNHILYRWWWIKGKTWINEWRNIAEGRRHAEWYYPLEPSVPSEMDQRGCIKPWVEKDHTCVNCAVLYVVNCMEPNGPIRNTCVYVSVCVCISLSLSPCTLSLSLWIPPILL